MKKKRKLTQNKRPLCHFVFISFIISVNNHRRDNDYNNQGLRFNFLSSLDWLQCCVCATISENLGIIIYFAPLNLIGGTSSHHHFQLN